MPDVNTLDFSNYDRNCVLVSNSFSFHSVRPVLSFSITASIVNETQNATADCKILAANPAPNITIRGNNNQIIPHIGGQAKLELITKSQAGEYSCIADNGVVGATTSTATLNVNCEYIWNVLFFLANMLCALFLIHFFDLRKAMKL